MRCSLGCMAYIAGSSEDRQQTGHLSYSSLPPPRPPSSFYKVLRRHRVTASLIGERSSGGASFHWRTQSRRPLRPLQTPTNLHAPSPSTICLSSWLRLLRLTCMSSHSYCSSNQLVLPWKKEKQKKQVFKQPTAFNSQFRVSCHYL